MSEISYRYCHFTPATVQNAIWLYCRFTLSFRDVKALLGERGIEVSYETIRRWVARFGPAYAKRLRNLRPKAHPQLHIGLAPSPYDSGDSRRSQGIFKVGNRLGAAGRHPLEPAYDGQGGCPSSKPYPP